MRRFAEAQNSQICTLFDSLANCYCRYYCNRGNYVVCGYGNYWVILVKELQPPAQIEQILMK